MKDRRSWLAPALAAGGVLCLAVALTGSNAADAPKGLNSVFYALDADTGERHWFSLDGKPDAWTRQFGFEEGVTRPAAHLFPLIPREFPASDAPEVELPAPELEVVEDRRLGERFRDVRLQVRNASGSVARAIWFEPPGAVVTVKLAGRTFSLRHLATADAPAVIQRIRAPAEEEMTLRIEGDEPVTIHVTDQTEGLPEIDGLAPRPEELLVKPLFTTVRSDVTLVHRSYDLPPARLDPIVAPREE